MSALPPGPKPVPVLGWRGRALEYFRNPLEYLTDLRDRFGNVACLTDCDHPTIFTKPIGPDGRTVFVFGHECNRAVLSNADLFASAPPRGPKTSAADRLADNLLFAKGEKHKQLRRLLMPAFSRAHLQAYHTDMVDYTERMIAAWTPGRQIDLFDEMHKLTRDIATRVLFGMQPSEDEDSLSLTIRRVVNGMFSPATMLPLDLPGTPFRRLRLDMEHAERSIRHEIERKRESGDGDDVLSMIIRARDDDGTSFTETELVAHAFVLFFAGHDTASAALSWTLYLLAQHPEIMEELREELAEHLGGTPPTYEQIYKLPVLDRIAKESLRLLGPAVVFPRVAQEDTQLGDFAIPAGTEVLYSSYMTHRDPEIFPEPARFTPDRWIDFKPPQFSYVPFGAGARLCIGSTFGMAQLRTVIATLVQRLHVEMIPDARVDISVHVVMSPTGLPMKVVPLEERRRRGKVAVSGYINRMVA